MGDRLSALFHDFDWADEVLHVEIARRCLRPELPGGLTEARQRADALWNRITDALERSREDLVHLRDGIAAELGREEAAIYDAHLLMVEDPELRRAVEEGIRREGRNAPWVFRNYMSGVAARMEQVENDYLRERHADVLDVERRILRHLLGEGSRTLPLVDQPSVLVAHDLGPSEVALLDRERMGGPGGPFGHGPAGPGSGPERGAWRQGGGTAQRGSGSPRAYSPCAPSTHGSAPARGADAGEGAEESGRGRQ